MFGKERPLQDAPHKASPSGGGAERSEAEGGRRQQRRITTAAGERTGPFVPAAEAFSAVVPPSAAFGGSSPQGGAFLLLSVLPTALVGHGQKPGKRATAWVAPTDGFWAAPV